MSLGDATPPLPLKNRQAAGDASISLSRRLAGLLPRNPALTRLYVVILLLLVWEAGARLFGDPLFIASFSQTVVAAVAILGDPNVVKAIVLAIEEIVLAYALAIVVGLALGLLVGLNKFVMETFRPLILMVYATPQAPFLPLFVMAFGIGMASKIGFGFTHGVFVIAVTVMAGVQNIDAGLLKAARSMGASRSQVFTTIICPTMLRSFFTGARLGLVGVIIGVLLAELYVTSGGVGKFTHLYTNSFRPPELFALASILTIIAVSMNELARRAEIRASLWRGK